MIGSLPRPRLRPFAVLATALLMTAQLSVAPTRAEVIVEGSGDALRVQARDSSVADVLAALNASFGLRYPPTANLDRPVSHTFSGSLQQVIARLLEQYDYVLTRSPAGEVEIIWIKQRGNSGVGAPGEVKARNVGAVAPPWQQSLHRRVTRGDGNF